MTGMMGFLRRKRTLRGWLLAALSLAGFALAAALFLRQAGATRYTLRLSAGTPLEMRYRLAELLAAEAHNYGIEIELKSTSGSEESYEMLEAGKLDLALAQGGLGHAAHHNLRQVSALHLEPMHLLVKKELYPQVVGNLAALKGKIVNVNKTGSGTHYLALDMLRFAGLAPISRETGRGDYIEWDLSQEQIETIKDYAKLPDATFLVTTLPSRVAKYLVSEFDYRLVPLPFAEAFALDALNPEVHPERTAAMGPDINKMYVFDTLIPAFTYEVEPGVPPEPTHTLGTRLLLVANKNVDPWATEKLLEIIFSSRLAHISKPPLDDSLLQLPPELPLHEGTLLYLKRNKPLFTGDVIDFLEKAVTIGAPLLGGILFLRQWLRQRSRRMRDEGFEHYIFKVTEIERRALQLEMSATLKLHDLMLLQQDLARLKAEALAKFVSGELEGEELMSGFLTHVNDARNYLARLILHSRDNLEAEAQLQGRPLRDLWTEALRAPAEPVAGPEALASAQSAGDGHQNLQEPVETT